MNIKTLSQVTKWLIWFWDLERIWSFELCLGVNVIALVLNEDLRKLGFLWMRSLGGIYSPQPLPSRWLFLLSMGPPDSPMVHRTLHCSFSGARHVSYLLGFGAVDCWHIQSSSSTEHSSDLWLRCSDFCTALFITVHICSRSLTRRERLLRWLIGQSGAHQTVLWIIADGAHEIPKSGWFVCTRTWCTGHCSVHHCSTLSGPFAPNWFESPTELLLWFVLNLMHLV
jgi:hypothetical protein